ncbi:MAG: protein kinase domain-containing protein [Egibacteraceae bacterium]
MATLLADRYALGTPLGAGGMARVVEAEDTILARRVAVKLLSDAALIDPKARDRFLAEARAAASLSHPNAVAVYDLGRDGDQSFIVMELVEGATLADVLRKGGPLTEEQAVAVAVQVLSALAVAHRRGLVHRDVKPANVLLPGGQVPDEASAPERVKLADFGIAKGIRDAASALTQTGQVIGTPLYLSPEQVSGETVSPRSDVYAVGVLLFEMLAGHPPFEGDNPLAIALAHRHDAAPRLDRLRRGLDPALVTVVERALAKDPLDRFADAGAMLEVLRGRAPQVQPPRARPSRQRDRTTVLEESPAPPRRDPGPRATRPAPERPPQRKRRSRTFLVPLLLGLLATGGIAFFYVLRLLPGDQLPF